MCTSNNGAREMELGPFDGGEDGEYNGVGFSEISQVFPMQNAYFFGKISFNRVYHC